MENIKATLARAVIRILRPLVRILLRHEISHSEFSELARRSYVEVAYKYFTIPKRKQTYSRVAVITGLSRKEVVRISQIKEDEAPAKKGPLNRATRVIGGWLRDKDFIDSKKEPIDLPLRAEEGKVSFEMLVARYSGDITARAILDELIRVGAVTKLDKQTVRLTSHGYLPAKSPTDKIDVISSSVADLLDTAVHNLDHEKPDARFQRRVAYENVPQHIIDEFKKYSHGRSLALLREFDGWLAERKHVEAGPEEPTGRVGVGVYYFEDSPSDGLGNKESGE